jgi:hypothetical protein
MGMESITHTLSLYGIKHKDKDKSDHHCDTCNTCKLNREKLKKLTADPIRKATGPMDIWSADLIGPFSSIQHSKRIDLSSRKGAHYALLIVDEYSRYTLIRLLTRKSDAPTEIVSLIKLMENKTDKKLKLFHCDGASELNGSILSQYFKENGIDHTATTPDTSEHNGIVERMNRKMEEVARCLINQCGGPQELCGDALLYATHIHNHTAIRPIGWKTAAMMFLQKDIPPIDIKRFHVFGCDAYSHVAKGERGKFQENGQPAVYIGYSYKENAHRLLLVDGLKEIISRDVKFKEGSFTLLQSITDRLTHIKEGDDTATTTNKKWTISHIADDRVYDGVKQYKVFWKGYSDSTWEPASLIQQDAPLVVTEYHDTKTRAVVPYTTRSKGKKTPICTAFVNVVMGTTKQSVIDYREPTSYDEAMHHTDREKWISAMKTELDSITTQEVFEAAVLPHGRKAIGCKWVYKVKRNAENVIEKWKARLVIQGFRQKEGIDYTDTFSPTVHIKSIKYILAIAAEKDYEIKQIDFDTAFLNATLEEEIYMKLPEGFHLEGSTWKSGSTKRENHGVLRLLKALYGLKQAPREWWLQLQRLLNELGYHSSDIDHCLYMKTVNGERMYLAVYVDDILAIFPHTLVSEWEKDKLTISNKYKLKDLGDCEWILQMSVTRDRSARTITLSQRSYIEVILSGHPSINNKQVSTPYLYKDITVCPEGIADKELSKEDHAEYRSIVGELLYAATISRVDIAYIVSALARYVNKPHNYHMAAAMRVLQYLKGREHYCLTFSSDTESNSIRRGVRRDNGLEYESKADNDKLVIYSDSNWGGDKEDRISVSGWLSTYNNRPVSWQSKKQSTIALSSTEAEYYALTEAVKEALFIKQWTKHYIGNDIQIEIRGDNMGSLFIADHTTNHNRNKHIDIKHFFVRKHVNNGEVRLEYIPTKDQLADILTKATSVDIFSKLSTHLLSNQNEKKE